MPLSGNLHGNTHYIIQTIMCLCVSPPTAQDSHDAERAHEGSGPVAVVTAHGRLQADIVSVSCEDTEEAHAWSGDGVRMKVYTKLVIIMESG
jgi:hypothetical protein